jgi:hypothetical protein
MLSKQMNKSVFISRIPNEILVLIFAGDHDPHASYNYTANIFLPVSYIPQCQRSVAINTASLWDFIQISVRQPMDEIEVYLR